MPYPIEKGIPITDGRKGSKEKYPWSQMEIGDSFFVPSKSKNTLRSSRVHANKAGKGVFKSSELDDETQGPGVRVWRIK